MPGNMLIRFSFPIWGIYIEPLWSIRGGGNFEGKETIAKIFPITIYLSLHPFILVDRTLCVHLPWSLLSLWAFLAMEDWSGGGTWFLSSDELPIEFVTLYLCFYINRNIHLLSKFHVQLFISVTMGIIDLYMFKWIMLVWMLTFNIFYAWIYICCWGQIIGNKYLIVSSMVVFFDHPVEVKFLFFSH